LGLARDGDREQRSVLCAPRAAALRQLANRVARLASGALGQFAYIFARLASM
jgi:hypothetical protein